MPAHDSVRPTTVRVVDIDMPFASMVGFMIKWTFASIPAMLIVGVIVGVIVAVVGLLTGSLGGLSSLISR